MKFTKNVLWQFFTKFQWAILLRKPILIFTTDELQKSPVGKHINLIAEELGKDIINLDHVKMDFDWNKQLEINDEKYKKYIENYIKIPGTPEKPIWSIVIDQIELDYAS